jgi:hypothetical protein
MGTQTVTDCLVAAAGQEETNRLSLTVRVPMVGTSDLFYYFIINLLPCAKFPTTSQFCDLLSRLSALLVLFFAFSRTMALESTKPLIEMRTRNIPGCKGLPAHKADNLTVICEPIV